MNHILCRSSPCWTFIQPRRISLILSGTGLYASQIKIDGNSLSATARHRLPQISLQASLVSKKCLLQHKFINKIEVFDRINSLKGQLSCGDFWYVISISLPYLNSLPELIVIWKNYHVDRISCLSFDDVRAWDWHCNQVIYRTRSNVKMKHDEVSRNDQVATKDLHSLLQFSWSARDISDTIKFAGSRPDQIRYGLPS